MPKALDKWRLTITFNHAERLDLEARARAAGQSVHNYVRQQLGYPPRYTGVQAAEQTEREADEAWEILKRLGLDPNGYFPQERLPDLRNMTPLDVRSNAQHQLRREAPSAACCRC